MDRWEQVGGVVVAPFTGAWIEILGLEYAGHDRHHVAPFTGAWIEISLIMYVG